uniref:PAX-interacting protein 1 n=1 Tax=Echinostoma caproni TaxID=27848 RepID=A0A183AWB6_9TREM
LAPLTEDQLNLALVCKTRSEKLETEVHEKAELQQHLARIRIQCPPVTDNDMQPAHLAQLEALITGGVLPSTCPGDSLGNASPTAGAITTATTAAVATTSLDEETRQSCTSTLSDTSQDVIHGAVDIPSITTVSTISGGPVSATVPMPLEAPADTCKMDGAPSEESNAEIVSVEMTSKILPSLPHPQPETAVATTLDDPIKTSGSPHACTTIADTEIQPHNMVHDPATAKIASADTLASVKPEGDDQMGTDIAHPGHVQISSYGKPSKSEIYPTSSNAVESKRPASVPYPASIDQPMPIRRKRCNSGSSVPIQSKRPAISTLFEVSFTTTEVPRPPSKQTETPSEPVDTTFVGLLSKQIDQQVANTSTIKVPEQSSISSTIFEIKQPPPDTPIKVLPSTTEPSESSAKLSIESAIRITFTAIDYDSRLSLIELCQQLPGCEIVEKAQDATHLICTRLLRTPKTYLALAVGCYLVTPKWIQASVLRGCWLDETPWLLSDPDSEAQLGCQLHQSIHRSRRRRMLGPEAYLFAGLEFWLSPRACHREMCIELIKACGGVVRLKRPTQKMALLPQPRQLIICHEDDSHVASYLMRIKTGNKAVHHEEFILSGVLRQELDFDAYQIQYVSTLQTGLKAAVAAAEAALANSGSHPMTTVLPAPTSLRFVTAHSDVPIPVTAVASVRSNQPRLDPNVHNKTVALSITTTTQTVPIVCQAAPCNSVQRSDLMRMVSVPLSACVSENPGVICSPLATRTVNVISPTVTTRVQAYHPARPADSQSTTRLPPEAYGTVQPGTVVPDFRNQANLPRHTSEPIIHHTHPPPIPLSHQHQQHLHHPPVPSTGLQHLLVGSSTGDVSIPTYLPPGYAVPRTDSRTDLSSAVRPPLSQEVASTSSQMLIAYTTPTVSTDPNGVARFAPGSSIPSALDPARCVVFVTTAPHMLSANAPLRVPSDAGRMAPSEMSLDMHKPSPKQRSSTLLLSGNTNPSPQLTNIATTGNVPVSTQISQAIPRPVTALTAMIVAAEANTNDLVPNLPLGETDMVVMGPVSSFVLPKPTGYHRPLNAPSSANVVPVTASSTATSALNARSAAADAHAVATATAAAANALHSAEAKGMVVGVKPNPGTLSVPVPTLRNSHVYTSEVVAAETKKRMGSGGSNVSGPSTAPSVLSSVTPLDDAVKSLITNQLSFQPLADIEMRQCNTMESVQTNPSDMGPSRSFSTSDIPTCFGFEDSVASSAVSQFSVVHSAHSSVQVSSVNAVNTVTTMHCTSSESRADTVPFGSNSAISPSRQVDAIHATLVTAASSTENYSTNSSTSTVVVISEPTILATGTTEVAPSTVAFWTKTNNEPGSSPSTVQLAETVSLVAPQTHSSTATDSCTTTVCSDPEQSVILSTTE